MKLGCVIMASGEGKRFGSNKMLADIYGKPLIARTIDSVPRGFDVVVSTRWPRSPRFARTSIARACCTMASSGAKASVRAFVGGEPRLEGLPLFAGRPAAREFGFF